MVGRKILRPQLKFRKQSAKQSFTNQIDSLGDCPVWIREDGRESNMVRYEHMIGPNYSGKL